LSDTDRDPPFEGGSQPVPHNQPEMPHGRGGMQVMVIVLAIIVLLGVAVFFFR
jgi:hypothetical protein